MFPLQFSFSRAIARTSLLALFISSFNTAIRTPTLFSARAHTKREGLTDCPSRSTETDRNGMLLFYAVIAGSPDVLNVDRTLQASTAVIAPVRTLVVVGKDFREVLSAQKPHEQD